MESDNVTADEITNWCDNERSVAVCNAPPSRLKDMIRPDADLVLAIHAILQRVTGDFKCRHVKGHQDTKKTTGDKH